MGNGSGTRAELQLAVIALQRNDRDRAGEHVERAHTLARSHARRDRQLIEIAQCAIGPDWVRAAGLAAEHCSNFPEDVELLASIVDTIS